MPDVAQAAVDGGKARMIFRETAFGEYQGFLQQFIRLLEKSLLEFHSCLITEKNRQAGMVLAPGVFAVIDGRTVIGISLGVLAGFAVALCDVVHLDR